MRIRFVFVLGALLASACSPSHSQIKPGRPVLVGSCEGCEAVLEYGDRRISEIDTLPDFERFEPRMKVTGTVWMPDGKTPAAGVVLYLYHTDRQGVYPNRGGETGWARRHGYIRGWVKTDAAGRYTVYTFRPGNYPGGEAPAHIHATVMEPDGRYYWIDDYLFADDPALANHPLSSRAPRGCTDGVLHLQQEGGLWVGRRDITLGCNVEGYR